MSHSPTITSSHQQPTTCDNVLMKNNKMEDFNRVSTSSFDEKIIPKYFILQPFFLIFNKSIRVHMQKKSCIKKTQKQKLVLLNEQTRTHCAWKIYN